ncbi:aminodeoxychorismate synthase component I [Rhodoferax sp.]|uniref:aminodeoxychorismate synthase component I n=1 Tax=Rhodoferax sp. TaxID=50421 RepID=UPI00262EF4C1|nr:aminodeoxychorismate synthase component I [Rhodoferax sp.]MDD5480575.1 aminodeoxychorismate synthase component I [Rhodoferax sp.]
MQVLIDFCDPHGGHDQLRCAFDAPLHTLVAHTPDQVKPLLDQVEAFSQQGFWCVGYMRYEAAPAFDAAFAVHDADGPLAWFSVYAQALPWPDDASQSLSDADGAALKAGNHTLVAVPAAQACVPDPTPLTWHSTLSRADFDVRMSYIHESIAAGEFYQVNYTAALHGTLTGEPVALFKRLQRAQPDGYAAFIDTGFEQLLSVSPELFFDWKPGLTGASGQLLTRPMKGTAPRGNTATEDKSLVKALLASPKERAENVMIVDLLRNDVSRIADPFSVQTPALFTVQTLPTVFQMVSDVTARTRPGTRLSEVFGALFPCGSITGAPKVQAMRAIKTLEPQARGVYCGAIGVVRPGGHATFNVAIRTVTLRGNLSTCGIGSGITFDATADAEWQEWQHKRGFLERASEPFDLLETLRLENGVYVNLIAHLARLSRAARHFGYVFEEARVRQTLDTLAAEVTTEAGLAGRGCDYSDPGRLKSPLQDNQEPATNTNTNANTYANAYPSAWRVRLLLGANDQPRAEKFILNQPLEPVIIELAATYFESSQSEFTRFKTTRRSHYDAFTPTDPAVFDTLLYNAAGELTECTRGNIALLLDGRWVTPPLHCGLLDGIGREVFLKEGRLVEAVVHVDDLPHVQALAFVNSLRGWMDARLKIQK